MLGNLFIEKNRRAAFSIYCRWLLKHPNRVSLIYFVHLFSYCWHWPFQSSSPPTAAPTPRSASPRAKVTVAHYPLPIGRQMCVSHSYLQHLSLSPASGKFCPAKKVPGKQGQHLGNLRDHSLSGRVHVKQSKVRLLQQNGWGPSAPMTECAGQMTEIATSHRLI